ncbi:MAG: DoxX family protein [Pirellulaceae bacterium]|nr:DoxX family protein [Pirellulaceae bacterium]
MLLLRLGTGWHFFKEGAKKFHGESFTSVYFLQSAKGPLADFYKSMIPDRQGRERLNQEKTKGFWKQYSAQAGAHFGFDEDQQKRANKERDRYVKRLAAFYYDNGTDIQEYLLECDRLEKAKADTMSNVEFQRDWIASKESELAGKVRPWLASIEMLGEQLQGGFHKIATDEQLQRGEFPITNRSEMFVDTIVKYVVIGVGVLLILGLFTRIAALAGMGFLLSVMSTQPPWVATANTEYFYYQMVEILALLVLMAFNAGRFAGLDFLVYAARVRCCPPKTTET